MRVSFLHTRKFMPGVRRSMNGMLCAAVLLLSVGMASSCSAKAAPSGASIGAGGQNVVPILASGKLVTRQFDAADFSGIDAGSSFKVDVVRGESTSVAVTADDNIIDQVEIANLDRLLKLNMKSGSYTNATVRVALTMPDLTSIRLSGSATATMSGFRPEILDVHLSGASKLTGRVEGQRVHATISEASNLNLGGTAETLTLRMSGASQASLGDLTVNVATASLKEASSATLNVKDKLDAELRSASNLYYVGNPTLGSVTSVEASSLRRR